MHVKPCEMIIVYAYTWFNYEHYETRNMISDVFCFTNQGVIKASKLIRSFLRINQDLHPETLQFVNHNQRVFWMPMYLDYNV